MDRNTAGQDPHLNFKGMAVGNPGTTFYRYHNNLLGLHRGRWGCHKSMSCFCAVAAVVAAAMLRCTVLHSVRAMLVTCCDVLIPCIAYFAYCLLSV